MLIKDMFVKDINRDIRGVIKVAQTSEDDIYNELDEYIVTKELKKHFSEFYENYTKSIGAPTDEMGVWVSGFFGSGKSHFIKILSYLLENKSVKGKYPISFFESKIDDPLLFGNMEKASSIETDTILFNIDSKSSVSYEEDNAILRVFKKVFDEHRGYYGDNPGISNLEKFLDENGQYDLFKANYEALAGEPWIGNQNNFYFRGAEIVEAIVQANGMSEQDARNWYENIEQSYALTIENFADEVKEYIDSKSDDYHLVFLVDEIGQYIADNRKLQLNLQTVVELLGAKCQGKVWVVVTSQEKIDDLVDVKGDDFSRIQGRFDTRLSLSSTSVDEVIKKRILEKTPTASQKLQAIYPNKAAILKNLIYFRGTTGNLRSYNDDQEFSEDYPFVPYQFKLLQNIFEQVRKHGSSGKHLSEGERSMLSAFQESAQEIAEQEEGVLVPLYSFYNTISEFLNPSIVRVINSAESNPNLSDDTFNSNLLKTLFLVKYIDDVPRNIDNLATLMVSHIEEDKTSLKEKISNSLGKLRQERLIQKNGENYEFLTDEEQDINREIQQIKIEDFKITREMSDYIFQDIYSVKNYPFSDKYHFAYNKQLDSVIIGKQSATIGINIITPNSINYDLSKEELMLQTTRNNELLIRLGGDESYVEELEEVLKIEQYRLSIKPSQLTKTRESILSAKQSEVGERRDRVRNLLEEALRDGTYYAKGSKLELTGSTAKDKINDGLRYLVENTYTKLHLINQHVSNEKELLSRISDTRYELDYEKNESTAPNVNAKEEVQSYITLREQMKVQITVKDVYNHFSSEPYGWIELDTAGILVDLFKEEKIRIRYNSEYLNILDAQDELFRIFTNNVESEKAIIIKRERIDEALISKVKNIVRDLFGLSNTPNDEDGLVKAIQEKVDKLREEVNEYLRKYEYKQYPGENTLQSGLSYFNKFNKQIDAVTYFNRLVEMKDELLNWMNDYSEVKDFFESNQVNLFDQANEILVKYEKYQSYLQSDEVKGVVTKIQCVISNPNPYSDIKNIPEQIEIFNDQFTKAIRKIKEETREVLELDYKFLDNLIDSDGVQDTTKERVKRAWDNFYSQLNDSKDIYKVEALANQSNRSKDNFEKQIEQEIYEFNLENESYVLREDTPGKEVERIRVSELLPAGKLTSEAEVDAYIEKISMKLKKYINEDKDIQII